MKKLFVILIAGSVLMAYGLNQSLDLPRNAQKKVQKAFEKLWPDVNITMEIININDDVNSKLNTDLKRNKLYKLKDGPGALEGYMFLSAAPSRYDYFDLMVIYHPDLTIAATDILIYREAYGGEIGSSRWLRQFIDKGSDDQITMDQDIQGISGATISVRSATNAIKKLTMAMKDLKDQGQLQ